MALRLINSTDGVKSSGRKMTKPCILFLADIDFSDGHKEEAYDCELDPDDTDGMSGIIMSIENVGAGARGNQMADLTSGESTLLPGDSVQITANGKVRLDGDVAYGSSMVESKKEGEEGENGQRNLEILGEKTVLVVRIIASDYSTSASTEVLQNKVFGMNGDKFNLKSGFEQCSYNQLRIIPAQGHGIDNGVIEVNVDMKAAGAGNTLIRNTAIGRLNEKGIHPRNYDHVMFCVPPKTKNNWIAYAHVNGWLSVYNDNWCLHPSAQMHEIGHNIGLAHSGEQKSTYGDQSGMMGYSYGQDEGPVMCFNAAKNWQLGWYKDRQDIASPNDEEWNGELVGICDYIDGKNNKIDENKTVLLKIEGASDADYFVSFNRKSGINSGTNEGGNQVLIEQKAKDVVGYAKSYLVAKLGNGGKYVLPGFLGPYVKVNSISNVADITVTMKGAPPESCDGATFDLHLKTDDFGEETSWQIKDNANNIVLHGGNYGANAQYYISECIPAQVCTFTISDAWGDGFCCKYGKGSYRVERDGVIKKKGAEFGRSETTNICDKNTDDHTLADPSITSPTGSPTSAPIVPPTTPPTFAPTPTPVAPPTLLPTGSPTPAPTAPPSLPPTGSPTSAPTVPPTTPPTFAPTPTPVAPPTPPPTDSPTPAPTAPPSPPPTGSPTLAPTVPPSSLPTGSRTDAPVFLPTPPQTVSSSEKYVVCGRPGWCNGIEPMLVDTSTKHEVRCCSENKRTGWMKRRGCTVWGKSVLNDNQGKDKCFHRVNFDGAIAVCANNDARLCTKYEMESGCIRGTGCGHDRDLIWTSTGPGLL